MQQPTTPQRGALRLGGGAGLLPWDRPGEMPAGGDVGPRDARTEPAGAWSQVDGGGRTAEPAGVPSRAAASAAPLLPGMSEELPRRLPSILGSATSPTALARGHSPLPGSPPSPPGASSPQPSLTTRSSADVTHARSRLSSDSRCRQVSARRQLPKRAENHTRTAIGCLAPSRAMCRCL